MSIDTELAQARADHRAARRAFGEAIRDQVAAEESGDSAALRDASTRSADAVREIASSSTRVRELVSLSQVQIEEIDDKLAFLGRIREELFQKRWADNDWWADRAVALTSEPVRGRQRSEAAAAFWRAYRHWASRAAKARRADIPELDAAMDAALTWVRLCTPEGVVWSLEDWRLVARRPDGTWASYLLMNGEVPQRGGSDLMQLARVALRAEHVHERDQLSERSA